MVKSKKLKLLIKFKKLFLYQFKIPKAIFNNFHVRVFFVSSEDDFIICYGNKKAYQILSTDESIIITKQYKLYFNNLILRRFILIITSIVVLFIFSSTSIFIREIKFKDNTLFDLRVYNFVCERLDKKLWFYTLNEDITTLNNNLRATFPNYAYLGVTKDSSTLIIDIELINIKKEEEKVDDKPGDIISNYDAVVIGINCKKGKVLVNLNQYVKKGEILVSGMLSDTTLVSSDAVICGKFVEYKKINIKKELNSFGLTGKIQNKINIKVGNNYLLKFDKKYQNQRLVITNAFNMFNVLSIVNVSYYEEGEIKIIYDFDSALNYAISLIYYELELYRKSNLEKIIEIKILNSYELENEYVFSFAVKQIKNIGYKSFYTIE